MKDALENDDTLLARWLNGDLSPEELKALEQHPDFPKYRRIVAAADRLGVPDADLEGMWARLLEARKAQASPPIRRRMFWISAAAAVFALLFVAWFFMQPNDSQPIAITSGIGELKKITLPDGSIVQLNAASELLYDAATWGRHRLVHLNGEALFDVQKNNTGFKVETALGTVEVLGTTFSIRQRASEMLVACFTGHVKATAVSGDHRIVEAGQQTQLQKGTWQPIVQNGSNSPSWLEYESRFDQAPLRSVLDEMERQYPVKITAPGLDDRLFSGAFPNNDLPLALRLVCDPLGLTAEKNGQNITIRQK